jgi:hypothetical protein
MKRRIWLNPHELNYASPITIKGTSVNVFPSPNDIPLAITGELFPDQHVIRILFEYPAGEEQVREQRVTDRVIVGVGRESNRLYRIEVRIDPNTENLPENFEQILRDTIVHLNPPQIRNFVTAQACIAHHGRELSDLLAN